MVKWEFNRKAIQFDDGDLTLSVEGKPVSKASAEKNELKLTWIDAAWGEGARIQQSKGQGKTVSMTDAIKWSWCGRKTAI